MSGDGDSPPLKVIVWNECRIQKSDPRVAKVYPNGLHTPIVDALSRNGLCVTVATLDEPEHGLSPETLADVDVLVFWSHSRWAEFADSVVERIRERVLNGMGLIVLHSAHWSKLFRRMMGTTCDLKWRVADDTEKLWVVAPGHPIVAGVGDCIELPNEEMYGEFFDIPPPDTLVLVSWFSGGEVFRSGCCFERGKGRLFYFRPGHETWPTYHHPSVQRIIVNAVRWAAPTRSQA